VRERFHRSTVTKLSLKTGQNGPKPDKSKKLDFALSDGWQRVYVDFAPDSEAVASFFKTVGFNRSPTPPLEKHTALSCR
jgi:hypothetical protein